MTACHNTREHSEQRPCCLSPTAALHGDPTPKSFCVKKKFSNEHRVGILCPIYSETLLFKDELFLKLHLSNCLVPGSWLPGRLLLWPKPSVHVVVTGEIRCITVSLPKISNES